MVIPGGRPTSWRFPVARLSSRQASHGHRRRPSLAGWLALRAGARGSTSPPATPPWAEQMVAVAGRPGRIAICELRARGDRHAARFPAIKQGSIESVDVDLTRKSRSLRYDHEPSPRRFYVPSNAEPRVANASPTLLLQVPLASPGKRSSFQANFNQLRGRATGGQA